MYHPFDLEATILDILYQKCLDRPLWVSESEVYWLIPHLSVTEREVREVLDQLVFHRRVLKQVGKYQISKAEFQSIKERIECQATQMSEEKKTMEQLLDQGKETQDKEEALKSPLAPLTQRMWRIGLIVCCGFLTIGITSLLYNVLQIESLREGNSASIQIERTDVSRLSSEEGIEELHKGGFSQKSVSIGQSQPVEISTDSILLAMQEEQAQLVFQMQAQAKQVRYLSYWLIVILGMLLCTALGLLRISSRYFFKKQE